MIKQTVTCDHCGKEIDHDDLGFYHVEFNNTHWLCREWNVHYQVCIGCAKQIMNFIEQNINTGGLCDE